MAQDWFDQIATPVQQSAQPAPAPSGVNNDPIVKRAPPPADPKPPTQLGDGQMWDPDTGRAIPIPGFVPDDKDKKSPTQLDLEAKQEGAEKRAVTVRSLMENVRTLYEQDIKGKPLMRGFGVTEYIDMLPKNERFTAAGNSILPLIRPLVAQTAKEGDSDKEMQVFMSYIPTADDSDITIEGKLNALEVLIGGMVDGKPPSAVKQELDSAFANQSEGMVTVGGKQYRAGPQETPPPSGPEASSEAAQGFMAGVGDVVQGLGNIPGLVANPANASINQIFGTNLSTDLGMTLRQALGLPDNPNEVASQINQAGAGALGLSGLARTATQGATGAVRGALDIAAAQPGRQALAAGTGAGTSEQLRQEGASPLAQLGGGLLAGGVTYAGGNALANTAQRAAGSPNSLLAAGQRQGVDILPADAGGPVTRRLTSAAAQAPVSAGPVTNAAQRSREQLGSAVSRTANREGNILEPDVAGEQIRAAGKKYVSTESARIGRLYEQAGSAAQGVRIKPLQAVSQIDEQLARYKELGEVGAPMVRTLEGIRSGIENGVSVQGMRDARTILSQGVYDGKLRSGQEKKVMGDIIEALSSDIELGLRQAGREGAARQFKRADQLWRERIQYIDETLEPIIGKTKSGEDILGALESMTRGQRGGVSRLRGIMREMPAEEAGNIRATVIDRLGRASAGQQDDTGSAFSAETFLTNWNKMSPRAKAVMFADGGLRSNLDDIAKLANATREAGRYANRSNTAGGIIGQAGATGGLAYISPSAAAITLGSQYLTGKLLASPRFTAWLARAPKNPNAQGRYVEQLSSLAAKEPALAGDARALQQYLTETLGGSGMKAAASGNGENPRPEPEQ